MTKIKLIGIDPNSGNNPANPNGMKLYSYKGHKIAAYCSKDVPNRYKYLFRREARKLLG